MFTFSADVPANVQGFLIPLLQAWIDRADLPLYGIETMRFGLVTFRRDPWPINGATIVSPAGEVDAAALQNFSASVQSVASF